MALFLAVLGGAAVAEVHRAITGGGNKDVALLKQKEEALKKQLQEIQRELQAAKAQRELTESEAAQLAVVNAELQAAKEELEAQSGALKEEKVALAERAARLAERQALLEQCTESLKLENSILIQQFEKLKVKQEREAAALAGELAALKAGVGAALQRFTAGQLTAAALVEELDAMGVTLECSEEDMARLERVSQAEAAPEARQEALEAVELKVDDGWMSQMRTVAASQDLAARLLAAGAASRVRTASQPASALATPRTLEAAEQKAAALKLASHAVLEEVADRIPAVRAEAEAAPAIEGAAAKDQQAEAPARPSLVFRPIKKAMSKAMKAKKQALVEVDGAVPVPRLSLDDLAEGPAANGETSMVAV